MDKDEIEYFNEEKKRMFWEGHRVAYEGLTKTLNDMTGIGLDDATIDTIIKAIEGAGKVFLERKTGN